MSAGRCRRRRPFESLALVISEFQEDVPLAFVLYVSKFKLGYRNGTQVGVGDARGESSTEMHVHKM